MSWRTVLSFLWRRDFLIPHDGIRKLIDDHIPYRNLEDAKLPVHIVTTDIISGDSVVLSEGSTAEAIVASTAIPGAFSPIRYKDYYLADGAISSNTPIQVAVQKGARRLIILPTGHACANAGAAGRRGRQCAACADAADRAAIGQRAGSARSRYRVFRGAAAMPAGGLTLRFLANRRSYRARHSDHRRLAGPARPAAGQDSARDAAAQPLSARRRRRYAALQKAFLID